VCIVLAITNYICFADVFTLVVGAFLMKVSQAEVARFQAQRAQLLASSASVQSPGAVDVEKVNNEGADTWGANKRGCHIDLASG
jgi:hypothetical protein